MRIPTSRFHRGDEISWNTYATTLVPARIFDSNEVVCLVERLRVFNLKIYLYPVVEISVLVSVRRSLLLYPKPWQGAYSGASHDIANSCQGLYGLHELITDHVWKVRRLSILRFYSGVVISRIRLADRKLGTSNRGTQCRRHVLHELPDLRTKTYVYH